MRAAIFLIVLALVAGCAASTEPTIGRGGPQQESSSPTATASPTSASAPKVIRYVDDAVPDDLGIKLERPGDIAALHDAPETFLQFMRELLGQTDDQCDLPRIIHVEAIDLRGLAFGTVNECGGYIAVWGRDDAGWRELFGTQGVGTPCPADLAGFTRRDIRRLAGDDLCGPAPTPTSAPQSPEPTEPVVNGGSFALGETAHFRYFDVTVHEKRSAANGVEGGGIYGARVTVCYTHRHPGDNPDGTTRTSRDPWRFGWAHGPDPVWERGEAVLSDRWKPAYRERTLRAGECNSGWLTSDIRETAYVAHIGMRYAPSDFAFSGTWSW